MNDSNSINIKTGKLRLTGREIDQLSTFGRGCNLQMVSCKSHTLDPEDGEDQFEDSETDEIFDEEQEISDRHAKEEQMRREFVSVIINANRDPVKASPPKYRFKVFEEDIQEGELDYDVANIEDRYISIHRMFENIGNFDDYMREHDFQELSPNRVYKLRRMVGVQLPVTSDSLVMYNCALWIQGSKDPFDSTWVRRTTFTNHLATDSILPGLHELLLSCNKGELCEAFIRPQAAFGSVGAAPRIPPNATIYCVLEIVKVVTREKLAILSNLSSEDQRGIQFEDFVEASDEARRRGNHFFQHGQYKVALQRYKSAIRLLEGLKLQDESQQDRVHGLLLKLYNNCARSANAMGNPRLALLACKQAAEIQEDPKTYWQRIKAWQNKGHPDRALGIARRALQLFTDPTIVKSFQKAADELKIKIQQDTDEETQLYRLLGRALVL